MSDTKQVPVDETLECLKLLLSWAENWDSPFLEDDEWQETDGPRIKAAIRAATGAAPASGECNRLLERVAQLTAHRACHSAEHDPQNGKLHGCCIVCGVPWPCEYAGTPPKGED